MTAKPVTPSVSLATNPFATVAAVALEHKRHLDELTTRTAWKITNFIAARSFAQWEARQHDRWHLGMPLLLDCVELAAFNASDPQAEHASDLAEPIEKSLLNGCPPDAELREFLGYLVEAAHPVLVPFREPLLAALDNGSQLRLRLDPADPLDRDRFLSFVWGIVGAFEQGNGPAARAALHELSRFFRNGWL